MIRLVAMAASLTAIIAAPASGEVVSSSPNGFELRHEVAVHAPPAQVWDRMLQVGQWWEDDHTYSGKAANMTLDARPGGCFCEATPANGGGVTHMTVAYVAPKERLVMTGALGPLLFEATSGVMDLTVKATPDGNSIVMMNYRAAGFARGNADKMAPLVDTVLGVQAKRLAAFAHRR
jgi:uncharacterized protein YndB with AHSA1/START domain